MMIARDRTYICEGLVETLIKRRRPFKTNEKNILFWGNRVLEVSLQETVGFFISIRAGDSDSRIC